MMTSVPSPAVLTGSGRGLGCRNEVIERKSSQCIELPVTTVRVHTVFDCSNAATVHTSFYRASAILSVRMSVRLSVSSGIVSKRPSILSYRVRVSQKNRTAKINMT